MSRSESVHERLADPSNRPAGAARAERRERYFSFTAAPRKVSRTYSRFVRWMKLLLPAIAALLITLVIAWPEIDWNQPLPKPGAVKIKPEDAENLSMLDPRYVGTDSRNRPFTVTAESARQLAPQTNRIALEQPAANMVMEDGTRLALSADTGLFDREASTLELEGSVSLYQNKGYELHSEAARIDLKAGTAEGNRPVSGQGPMGTVSGEGFRVLDEGNTIIFTGESSLLIRPDKVEERQE